MKRGSMHMMFTRFLRGAGAAVLFASLVCAQTGPAGYWEGAFTAGIGAANMAPGEGLQGIEAYALVQLALPGGVAVQGMNRQPSNQTAAEIPADRVKAAYIQ